MVTKVRSDHNDVQVRHQNVDSICNILPASYAGGKYIETCLHGDFLRENAHGM
jgi:hypothetical protein